MLNLKPLDKRSLSTAQEVLTAHHYLHRPVDPRCSVEGYEIQLLNYGFAGYFLFGRPEATRCQDWYGSVDDVQLGRCEVTRWQVLNLARVWIAPEFQRGGAHHRAAYVPGFKDRKGSFRSTLLSDAIGMAIGKIGFDYLIRRPPCFLDEPYEIRYLMSYCDTRIHQGTIYKVSGFELYRTNEQGIQTWRKPLPSLTDKQHAAIQQAARSDKRSQEYRARRAQLSMW